MLAGASETLFIPLAGRARVARYEDILDHCTTERPRRQRRRRGLLLFLAFSRPLLLLRPELLQGLRQEFPVLLISLEILLAKDIRPPAEGPEDGLLPPPPAHPHQAHAL